MQVFRDQPAFHPYSQPAPVLLQQFQDYINKKLQNKTEEHIFHTSKTNQEWKFLNEEKKAKFCPGKSPQ